MVIVSFLALVLSAGRSFRWAGSAFLYPETSRRQVWRGVGTHASRAVQNFWTRDRPAQGEQCSAGTGRHAARALLLTRMNVERRSHVEEQATTIDESAACLYGT